MPTSPEKRDTASLPLGHAERTSSAASPSPAAARGSLLDEHAGEERGRGRVVDVRDLDEASARLTGRQLVRALHKKALAVGAHQYIDPATGFSVFTEVFLSKRPCCGSRCRHCPHGHVNVPQGNARVFEW